MEGALSFKSRTGSGIDVEPIKFVRENQLWLAGHSPKITSVYQADTMKLRVDCREGLGLPCFWPSEDFHAISLLRDFLAMAAYGVP